MATETHVIKMQGEAAPTLDLTSSHYLTGIDYAIVFIILFSAFISLWRGFTKEAFSLLVWLIALWLGVKYGDLLAPRFTFISEPMVRSAISYALVFLGALIVGGLLNILVGRLIKGAGLSVTDRFFGIFFGAARGLLFVGLFVLLAGFTPVAKEPWWHASVLIPHFERAVVWLHSYLPDNIKTMLQASSPST